MSIDLTHAPCRAGLRYRVGTLYRGIQPIKRRAANTSLVGSEQDSLAVHIVLLFFLRLDDMIGFFSEGHFWAPDDAGYNKQDSEAGWVVKKSGSASSQGSIAIQVCETFT